MKIIKETEKILEFEVECMTSEANAMRRTIIGGLPIYAIDKVVFYENNSTYFDEFIAHRIGLVPMKIPMKATEDSEEVMLTLNVSDRNVYSRDIKGEGDIKVDNGDIPIVKLIENQSVRTECIARVGLGRAHAKFQAGIASYTKVSDGKFKFMVESFGQMKAKDMVLKAIDLIQANLEKVENAVE